MTCRLCASAGPTEFWDTPLFESRNLKVLPSLGALVEGWLLLVPKQHVISFGGLDTIFREEVSYVKNQMLDISEQRYGMRPVVFEHGPHMTGHTTGCSVDHAHLHIVPIGFDLAEAAQRLLPDKLSWRDATDDSCREAFSGRLDYLYLEQPTGARLIATAPEFESQVLRRAIATKLGVPGEYNWRDYPHITTVGRTIAALSSAA